ncbi:lipopolysaccharide biosynthesis protein [Streptomyces bugieae]|uniref:Lipopolysaccharide biosynthesis protein n=1 Tax=Streptomyces bugieae TaxID=3098223 RepID=A0ABU7P1C0_9ACTN|nr:lipopolysaccharide biosynthesis protein [Streptomyces sp. DSM 41528]
MHGTVNHAPTGRPRGALRRLRDRFGPLPRWWPVPLCALLGAAGGAVYQAVEPPRYAATGYVAVVPGKGADPAAALGFAQAYGRIATSGAVLADAHRDSGLPLGTLRGGIRAATSPDAPMIEITGTARTPAGSAGLANAVTRSLARTGNRTAARTGAHLLVFARASAPDDPVSPSAPLATAVGGAAGGLLGGLVLLVRPRERRPAVRAGGSVPAPAHAAVEAGAVPAAEDAVR